MSADEWAGIRVYMQDRAKFLRDAASIAASTEGMAAATDNYARASERANKRSWAMNQALFTFRRMVYGATLAVAGAVTGVALLGFQFDSMSQTANIAFTTLLGNAAAANKEVSYLYELAAQTPFEFSNVQQFARQFLGWGFSIQQTNRYLKDFADVISAMGGDVSVMDRISLAFGQIRSAGTLLGQDLRQLQQAVPGVSKILQEQLNLTPQQMARGIGALHIPSNIAIEAIMRGIESDPRFAGAAAKLQKTFTGQVSTLHDYAARLFGAVMQPAFDSITNALPNVNKDLAQLNAIMSDQGFFAMVRALDGMLDAGGNLTRVMALLVMYGRALWAIFSNSLIPSLEDVGSVALPIIYGALYILGSALQFASQHGTILRIVFDLLIARFILMKGLAMAALFFRLALAIVAATVALISMNSAEAVGLILAGAQGKSLALFARIMLVEFTPAMIAAGGATWAFTAALLANPITWIVLGVLALTIGLIVLYMRWQAFHDLVDRTFHLFLNNWPLVLNGLAVLNLPLAILIGSVILLIKYLSKALDLVKSVYNYVGDMHILPGLTVGDVASGIGGAASAVGSAIPFAAQGGTVFSSGWTVIGENGPELMHTRAGSRIVPLERSANPTLMNTELEAVIPIIIKVDATTLAEVNARVKLRKRARQ